VRIAALTYQAADFTSASVPGAGWFGARRTTALAPAPYNDVDVTPRTRTPTHLALLALLALALVLAPAHAQVAPTQAQIDPPSAERTPDEHLLPDESEVLVAGDDPAEVADEAVTAWLERPATVLTDLIGRDTSEVCQLLPELVAAPPPPEGTRVNLEDRREHPLDEPDRKRFTYSAVRPADQLDVVQVELVREDDTWRAVSVGFRVDAANRGWLASPVAGGVFLGLSLLVLLLLVRPSPLRRVLAAGLGYVREHRRLVFGTMIALYLAFAAGVWSGSALPPECDDAVIAVLGQALGQVGATDALLAGDPLRLAVTIFYQNFGVVTLLLFWLGLLLGVPAYLLAFPQFFANGLPFGVLYDVTGPLALLATALLIVIELTAYFLVVAGGGMLLVTIVRQGLGSFPLALRKTLSMLAIAAVMLMLGAWYEVVLLLS